jgi:methionine-rich copper-binding protein CopC
MSRLVVLFAAVVAAACSATPAFAHAKLVSTSRRTARSWPRRRRRCASALTTRSPSAPDAVVAADRSSVLAGSPRFERGGHELVLPLGSLGNGDYSVRWGIVSDDGHFESGLLAFRVASTRSVATPAAS